MFLNILEKPSTFYYILITILTIVFEIIKKKNQNYCFILITILENAFVQILNVLLLYPLEPKLQLRISQSLENDETFLVGRTAIIFWSFRTGSRNCR